MRRTSRFATVLGIVGVLTSRSFGLISGGTGNDPVPDPGWPAGAAEVFNQPTRVAHWEGPPFGGGQSHGEYRGDVKDLNTALEHFAKIHTDVKRVIVREGIGHSFWLNPNREAAKDDASKIDWTFMVWQQGNWGFQKKLSVDMRPPDVNADSEKPPVEIKVFTGGKINWADVVVPPGITTIDERLSAHGFNPSDGAVIEGKITDLSNRPIASQVQLQHIEPLKKGGYQYTTTTETKADAEGHWVIKHAPTGWYQLVATADGVVPRTIGYITLDGQPGWHSYDSELSPVTTVKGHVVDDTRNPLSGASVRLDDVACKGKAYQTPEKCETTTDNEGRFELNLVAAGKARIWVHKTGHTLPGLGPTIETPADDIELKMSSAGKIHAVVDFGNATRPKGYLVELTPAEGNAIGSYGGSSQVSDSNEVSFKDVPPGRYELVGQPNPSSDNEKSKSIAVEVKGGATAEVKITAK